MKRLMSPSGMDGRADWHKTDGPYSLFNLGSVVQAYHPLQTRGNLMRTIKMILSMPDALQVLGLDQNALVKEGLFITKAGDTLFTGGLKCCVPRKGMNKTDVGSAGLMGDVS